MVIFLIAFLFSAELPLVDSDTGLSILQSEQSLSFCFQNKQQLLNTCRQLICSDKLGKITEIWTELNNFYAVVDECDTCSMGYEESRKYEFFYALCCLSIRGIQDFLYTFNKTYQTVFIERQTKISASFLMVCAVLEDNPIKALELLTSVVQSCADTHPLIFVAQFAEQDHGLPRAAKLMRVEGDEEDFLIAELQRLVAARIAQSDPVE